MASVYSGAQLTRSVTTEPSPNQRRGLYINNREPSTLMAATCPMPATLPRSFGCVSRGHLADGKWWTESARDAWAESGEGDVEVSLAGLPGRGAAALDDSAQSPEQQREIGGADVRPNCPGFLGDPQQRPLSGTQLANLSRIAPAPQAR